MTNRSMTLDDLEVLLVRIFGEFRGISLTWEATTANEDSDRVVTRLCTFQHYDVPCVDSSYS